MPKCFLLLLLITTIAAASAQAQNYKTAIGLRLSSNDAQVNNALTVKHFLNPVVALEGLVSVGPAAVGLLGEVHQPVSTVPGLRWLYGGGGFVGFTGDISAGLQGILGLDYKFVNIPLNLSVDWKPELDLINEFRFEPAAVGISARFTIK
jgi:hypothetical protein